jgi:hypothetical protein
MSHEAAMNPGRNRHHDVSDFRVPERLPGDFIVPSCQGLHTDSTLKRKHAMSETTSGALVAALKDEHKEWRKDVGEALASVRAPEAGVWERWAAARYLVDQFGPRLDRELHILIPLADRLPAQPGRHVWALGELLQFLCHHLCELGAMPQCGPAFAAGVIRLIRALDFWCRGRGSGGGRHRRAYA